jgi:hypothetical protein
VGFAILGGLLALAVLSWLISKGLNLLAADSARETPSRALAGLKLVLGVPLVYLFLVGLNPQWSFGLLPAGSAGPLVALAYAIPIAVGVHCALMGSFAWAGLRPPVWLRGVVALGILGLGAGLGPAASGQYQAYERSVGNLPLYVSDFGHYSHLEFMPAAKGLFLIGNDGKVDRWTFGEGVEMLRGGEYGRGFWKAEFSPDHRYLAWTRSSEFGVFDLTTKKDVFKKTEYADALAFDRESKTVAISESKGAVVIELWDLAAATLIRSLPVESKEKIAGLAFHPDGKRLYAVDEKAAILVRDTAGGEPKKLAQLSGSIFQLRASPDGQLLAASGAEPGVAVLNADTGALVTRFMGHGDETVYRLAFSSNGRQLFSASGVLESLVIAWDARTGKIFFKRPAEGYDHAFAVSSDDKLLATGEDYNANVWDISRLLPHE